MNKAELVRIVAKETKTPLHIVKPVVTSFIEQIAFTILNEERVSINALGSFCLRDKRKRSGYDALRNIPIDIPGGKKVKFKASPSFESKLKELYSTKILDEV